MSPPALPVALGAGAFCLALAACSSSAPPRSAHSASATAQAPATAQAAAAATAGAAASTAGAAGGGPALPAYSDTVLLPPKGSSHVNGFGSINFLGAGTTSCRFQWATQHPFGFSGAVEANLGRPVTLHAFRDARLTLTSVDGRGCTFAEYLPSQVPRAAPSSR